MITTPTKQSIGGVDCTIITNYFLRVLGALCGSILLTAEFAEHAKIFVKMTCSTFLKPTITLPIS